MKTSLTDQVTAPILSALARADTAFAAAYPGDTPARQPVHTVYGGAHLFRADSAASLGHKALDVLRQYAPDAGALADVLDLNGGIADTVFQRVVSKLEREPVEDYRIDFEDGFGYRTDAEEDAQAERTAREMARGLDRGLLPPFVGIRIKSMAAPTRARAMRTLDLFLSALLHQTGGKLPAGFAVTLAKVTAAEQVAALADLLDAFEPAHVRLEVMVETPQAIIGPGGGFALPSLVEAARGRCRGAHFGPYDYTAACNITAAQQSLRHPACDYARQIMLVCLAQRGIFLSDGPTNIMPISREGDARVIHRAWRVHAENIRRALENGFYQGWDLHPAQLPSRYAAVYAFFLEGLEEATARLENFMERAARATLAGDVFDDAATGQGLLNYFLRGLSCGALTEDETLKTGLTVEELRTRSFSAILERRRR